MLSMMPEPGSNMKGKPGCGMPGGHLGAPLQPSTRTATIRLAKGTDGNGRQIPSASKICQVCWLPMPFLLWQYLPEEKSTSPSALRHDFPLHQHGHMTILEGCRNLALTLWTCCMSPFADTSHTCRSGLLHPAGTEQDTKISVNKLYRCRPFRRFSADLEKT